MSGKNTGSSSASARVYDGLMFSICGSSGHRGSTDSTSVAPRCAPRTSLISLRGGLDDRLVGLDAGKRQHRLADDADAHALERARRARSSSALAA